MVAPRQWYAQRIRSVSHTSSDQDQYQDASEYLDLDVGTLSLSASSLNKEHAPESSGGNTGDYLEDVDDDEDVVNAHHESSNGDSPNLDSGEDSAHASPSLSDEAVVADNASSSSSDEAQWVN